MSRSLSSTTAVPRCFLASRWQSLMAPWEPPDPNPDRARAAAAAHREPLRPPRRSRAENSPVPAANVGWRAPQACSAACVAERACITSSWPRHNSHQQRPTAAMCICVDCQWVDRCKAYHRVETQHGEPHLNGEPDFEPEQPRIHVSCAPSRTAGASSGMCAPAAALPSIAATGSVCALERRCPHELRPCSA